MPDINKKFISNSKTSDIEIIIDGNVMLMTLIFKREPLNPADSIASYHDAIGKDIIQAIHDIILDGYIRERICQHVLNARMLKCFTTRNFFAGGVPFELRKDKNRVVVGIGLHNLDVPMFKPF